MEQQKYEVTRSYCNHCLQETNHDLIATRHRRCDVTDHDGEPISEETTDYDFVQCRGCENASLRRRHWEPGYREDDVDYFPPAVSRRRPQWWSRADQCWLRQPLIEVRQLLHEVYTALFAGSNRLAMMGLRAVVDLVLNDKLGDSGGFATKLKEAEGKGWVTPLHHRILSAAVDAGHAAAHRGYRPDRRQVERVLDVVENLIESVYVLEGVADEIAKQTPQRGAKTPEPKRY